MQQARLANSAMADFHRELDARFGTADSLHGSCANLKDSCIDLRATATATLSDLALLIALMGCTHEWVLDLEAATAKNKADVATTMAALSANAAAHATTAAAAAGIGTTVTNTVDAAVAGIGMTVTNAIDDLVGKHTGSLKSNVSSLGQDVLALHALLATMQGAHHDGTIPPHSNPPTVPLLKDAQPAPIDTSPPLEPA